MIFVKEHILLQHVYEFALIFKSINVKQIQRLSDFRRVSDNLTISQAYQMLEKGEHSVSAENEPGSANPVSKN